jgi:hypothetical protein
MSSILRPSVLTESYQGDVFCLILDGRAPFLRVEQSPSYRSQQDSEDHGGQCFTQVPFLLDFD